MMGISSNEITKSIVNMAPVVVEAVEKIRKQMLRHMEYHIYLLIYLDL